MIELIDFGKDYGDFTAVERLNLKIDAGETGLIGDYERLMALLLQQVNSKTGMLGVGPNDIRYGLWLRTHCLYI